MPQSKIKFLSPEEKRFHLVFLNSQIAEGNVDKEFIPYLSEINQLDGICTTQSCTGHKRSRYQDDGHLRFRLSAKMMKTFQQSIHKFYECRNIGYVGLRYHPGRRLPYLSDDGIYPEVMVSFLGLNRSPEIFRESIEHIVKILTNLGKNNFKRNPNY